jgi:hypothetical protein
VHGARSTGQRRELFRKLFDDALDDDAFGDGHGSGSLPRCEGNARREMVDLPDGGCCSQSRIDRGVGI